MECCRWQTMEFKLVAVPILPLFLVTRYLEFHSGHCPFSEIPPLPVCSGSWARFENEATYWNAGQCGYCPGPPRDSFCRYLRRVPFMTMFCLWQWLLFLWQTFLCSASARNNCTIRTHRSSCCLWSTTFAFVVCVTVLERSSSALQNSDTNNKCKCGWPQTTRTSVRADCAIVPCWCAAQKGLSQKQQSLSQTEHCHERYTTLVSAKTYLTEVPGSIHTVPRSSRLFRSQTAPNCRSTLGVEVFPRRDNDRNEIRGTAWPKTVVKWEQTRVWIPWSANDSTPQPIWYLICRCGPRQHDFTWAAPLL